MRLTHKKCVAGVAVFLVALVAGITAGAVGLARSDHGGIARADETTPEVTVDDLLAALPSPPAGQETTTYALSDARITWPAADPARPEDSAPSDSLADVAFDQKWTGGYPGVVVCTVVLRDTGGAEVGQKVLGVDAPSPSGRVEHITVPVTGRPSSAEGSCTQGVISADAGYEFTLAGIQASRWGNEGESTALFDTRWATADPPYVQSCELTANLTDGSVHKETFTYSSPSDRVARFEFPYPPGQVRDAAVKCTALEAATAR